MATQGQPDPTETRGVAQDRLAALAEHSSDVLFRMRIDPVPALDYVSPAIKTLTGYSRGEFEADPGLWRTLVHPDDHPLATMAGGRPEPTGEPVRIRLVDRSGAIHWVEYRATQARDASGAIVLEGVARDVTASRDLEERLRAGEERLRAVLEAAPVLLFSLDRDGIVTLLEGRAVADLGLDPAAFVGQSVWERAADQPKLTEALRTAYSGTAVTTGFDVSGHTLEVRLTPVTEAPGAVERVVGAAIDVTSQRRSQARLKLLGAALGAAANAIIITDSDGVIGWVNAAFGRLTGYPLDEVIGQTPRILKSSHQDAAYYADLWRTITAGRVWHGELINRRKDGTDYIEEMTIAPVRDEYGTITNFIAVKTDISARRAAEAALEESEERFRAVIDEAPIGMVLIDLDGRLGLVNRAFEAMVGRAATELAAMTFRDLLHPDDAPEVEALGDRLLGDGAKVEREFRLLRADGSHVWVQFHGALVRDRQGEPLAALAMVEDTTARRELEAQLRQAAKMEAVGQLAGGVAHDFNNLLTAINGYAEILATDLPADDPNREYALEIGRAGTRAAELTSRLLTFGRRQLVLPAPVSVAEVVASVQPMLRRVIGEDVDLLTRHAEGLWPALVDRGQLEQVIVNLVVNARDAMPRGGRITITTTNRQLDSAYVARHPTSKPGRYVCLEVRDTGMGIPEAIQRRVFEPFFTTKEQGRGTGLGLATVFGTVTQAGGHIELESRVGAGTTFRVYLPRARAAVAEEDAGPAAAPVRHGTEVILLAEDETAVRAFAARILVGGGYHVIEAANGAEALSLASSSDVRIDLLVTDIVMPSMGGLELADRIGALHPETRVLYVTGYADVVGIEGRTPPPWAILRKPYTVAELSLAVRDTLDDARGGHGRAEQEAIWPELAESADTFDAVDPLAGFASPEEP